MRFIPSMEEFQGVFKAGYYSAVILDNKVTDGDAISYYAMDKWVRERDPIVPIALNSIGESGYAVERTVGARDTNKNPHKMYLFLKSLIGETR